MGRKWRAPCWHFRVQAISFTSRIVLAVLGAVASPAQTPGAEAIAARYERPTPFPRETILPAGTLLRVRLEQTLDTKHSRAGDGFAGSVVAPVVANGVTVVPRGARAFGRVVKAKPSGRFRGRALLAFRLDAVEVRGRRYVVRTAVLTRTTAGHKKRNLAVIGGATGFGAAVGAIAGGGGAALIGAGSGAVAGTVTEAITGRKQVRLPVETPVYFRLRSPATIS
jgi:hypothetical protein